MDNITDECNLESYSDRHGIAAGLFAPFVLERLCTDFAQTDATLAVTLRDVGSPGEVQRNLRLSWSAASVLSRPPGVQGNTVTEWAALGLACVLVPHYTGLSIRRVALPGDCFDYWVTDGKTRCGLEVSGTMTDDLAARHREKLRQLLDNPYRINGYILVVSFAVQRALLSFHRFPEDVP